METRSRAKVRGPRSRPRATFEGGIQPGEEHSVTSVDSHVNSPSSATGTARGGKAPSRIFPPEGGLLRALSPCPRSESAGGASGSPDGDPPRRQEREKEKGSGDEGGPGTFDCALPVAAADKGITTHQPDDGPQLEFTMVPSAESVTRGSAAAPRTSAIRESAVSGASHSTMPTSGADFHTRYAATHAKQTTRKQSTPGPFNQARTGTAQTKPGKTC